MTEARPRPKRVPLAITVVRKEWISPTMVRVVFGGADLERFPGPSFADAYVKLVFVDADLVVERPIDLDAIKEHNPPERWPRLRTYTIRGWEPDGAAGPELVIDFVVHGDEGLAGPWARDAAPGDELFLLGPGGAYAPDPDADWHLLVGDESALPAIAAAVEALPRHAVGHVLVEVEAPEHEQPLGVPDAVSVTWVHRAGGAYGAALVEATTAITPLPGRVHAFVHGEAGFVRDLRRHLRLELGVPKEALSISGYWRAGADDEAWRAQKGEWNRAIAASEDAAA